MFKHKSASFHDASIDTQLKFKPPKPELISNSTKRNSEVLSHPPELLAKLYQTNRLLEQNIIKLNETQQKLAQKEEEILDLKQKLRCSTKDLNEKNEKIAQLTEQLKGFKTDMRKTTSDRGNQELQQKLHHVSQHNEALFQDYQSVLLQNQNYQQQIIELQDQLNSISYRLRESEQAIQLIKETETKVNYLELDVDRLEEKQKKSLPGLMKQNQQLKVQYETNIQLLNCGVDYIATQFQKSITTLTKQLQMVSKFSKRNVVLSETQLNFYGLNTLAQQTNSKRVQQILQKMNISETLQSWLEGIVTFLMINCQEILQKEVDKKLDKLSRQIQQVHDITIQLATSYDFMKFGKNKCNNMSAYSQKSNSYCSRLQDKENEEYSQNIKLKDFLDLALIKLGEHLAQIQQLNIEFQVSNFQNKSSRELQQGLKEQLHMHENLTNYLKKELISIKKEITTNSQRGQVKKYSYMPKII
ncbi:unnamed protein product [Paramecium pentaurelia]|uniref:Uncharacterized protein n=1 Tax=Paramecium pentaurelia TaxID=43138 RepID=A0A8S1W8V4_9CILI|nr:unnamed protein product [Paramecium pentaurelia]